MQEESPRYNYNDIPLGFYDEIAHRRKGIRSFWHNHKFKRVIDNFENDKKSILDIGCFSGTFLSMIPQEVFQEQLGVDILKEQIDFAQKNYGKSFRSFKHLENLEDLSLIKDEHFDYVSVIEVIEHLTSEEILSLINMAYQKLKKGGKLIITTPNYTSFWPVLEFVLNKVSDVKYEEQHISKFNYFKVEEKLNQIIPDFNEKFKCDYKTTTHFITPYISIFSYNTATRMSSAIPHKAWTFPFGSLILARFEKK
jgi:2-polyprenyl-3-methyl-5-hydroxy-6-metoxy-1,4-benzoquinol methylase